MTNLLKETISAVAEAVFTLLLLAAIIIIKVTLWVLIGVVAWLIMD